MDICSQIYHEDASTYFAPAWCTSLKNSSLWIGGCQPSSFIRLIYAMGGSKVQYLIAELMQGTRKDDIGELAPKQMSMINNLQLKTIKEEDKMSGKLASLQEDMADQPISILAKYMSIVGEPNGEVERALDEHDAVMAYIIDEADKFRLSTLKELMHILTASRFSCHK